MSFSEEDPVVIEDYSYNSFFIYKCSERWYNPRDLKKFWEDAKKSVEIRNNKRKFRSVKEQLMDDEEKLEEMFLGLEGDALFIGEKSMDAVLVVQKMQRLQNILARTKIANYIGVKWCPIASILIVSYYFECTMRMEIVKT